MAHFDHTRRDFEPYGFTCTRWTPTRMRRPDRHNEIEINLLRRGSVTYVLGGRKVTVPAGRLAVFWAAIPHQIVAAEGSEAYFVATIPLAWFLQCAFPEHLVQPVLHGQMLFDRTSDADDVRRFELWLKDLKADPVNRQRPVFLEMEARLLRLALSLKSAGRRVGRGTADGGKAGGGTGETGRGDIRDARLTKVEQMAAFVAIHYTEPLAVADVAGHVGLHPNHAMNLFKRAFGATLLAYLTQHRISHAQRLLATTQEKVLAIALDSGFGSISRFNATFRTACGCSPRVYRALHQIP